MDLAMVVQIKQFCACFEQIGSISNIPHFIKDVKEKRKHWWVSATETTNNLTIVLPLCANLLTICSQSSEKDQWLTSLWNLSALLLVINTLSSASFTLMLTSSLEKFISLLAFQPKWTQSCLNSLILLAGLLIVTSFFKILKTRSCVLAKFTRDTLRETSCQLNNANNWSTKNLSTWLI